MAWINRDLIWDGNGRISRSPEVVAFLQHRLSEELSPHVEAVTVDPQEWSGGRALHFSGTWRETGDPVLTKVGVAAHELHWASALSEAASGLCPTLYASGERLAHLRLRWMVLERVPFGPLGPLWLGNEFRMLLEAAVRFQKVALGLAPAKIAEVDQVVLRGWLEEGLRRDAPGPAGVVADRVPQDFQWVASVCELGTCHGDAHLCNGLTRTPPPTPSPVLLIDPQPIRQPWAFDAGYLQVCASVDKERVGYRGLIPMMSRLRAQHGLDTCADRDVPRLSRTVLAWFAIRQWGWNPDRHPIPDYRDETRRYIEGGASV